MERSAGSPHHLSGLGDVKRKGEVLVRVEWPRTIFRGAQKRGARTRD